MILIVGATGQLGTWLVRRLSLTGQPVRAFVRQDSAYHHLEALGGELAFGDLRDAASIDTAVRGADTIITTATTTAPRTAYSFAAIDGQGNRDLIDAAKRHGVKQFVLVSTPVTPIDHKVPMQFYRRRAEEQLQASGVPYTVLRAAPFMEDWMALLGSTIPYRGVEQSLLNRPYKFAQLYIKIIGGMVDRHGIALIPGNGKTRHAFVLSDDVGEFAVRALGHPQAQNVVWNIGGPEILSWDQAADVFGKVLARPLHHFHMPVGLLKMNRALLGTFSEAAGNLMGLNWMVAAYDTPYDMRELSALFGIRPTRIGDFLQAKLRLGDRMPMLAPA